jgi:hypothetical protein
MRLESVRTGGCKQQLTTYLAYLVHLCVRAAGMSCMRGARKLGVRGAWELGVRGAESG